MIKIKKEEVVKDNATVADIDSFTDAIIEEELKNFEIIENNSESEETDANTDTDISEETAKIKDLLESIILVMLFVMAMRHKNIENKQKVVMDFVKERKDIINRICVCMEKTIAKNAELYKKLQKANDISFIIQLVILALEFEGLLIEMERKTVKQEKKEDSRREKQEAQAQNQLIITTKTETGMYAEAW